jgi:iron-sulfur cluster repair protein YtfE (RIC family)
MDAIALLKEDHELFRDLLEQLEETEAGDAKRVTIFNDLKARLIAHETIEEEILYPALQEFAQAEEIVAHSYEEHHVVDLLLDELTTLSFSDAAWGAKAHVLEENLLHHLKDEESELFPKAKRLLDADALEDIGTLMDERRDEVMASPAVRADAKAVKPKG